MGIEQLIQQYMPC